MWFPCAHHVVSRWTPFGLQVDTMWFPGGQHRVSKMDTMWFLQDSTGFPHGCHVVSIWTPCVVEVTTWKPAQKQLCMKPTGFLVISCIFLLVSCFWFAWIFLFVQFLNSDISTQLTFSLMFPAFTWPFTHLSTVSNVPLPCDPCLCCLRDIIVG